MMIKIAVLLVLISSSALAQRAVVCPPHLDYCYEKPVLREMTGRDQYNKLKAEMDADLAAVQNRARAADYGFQYQMNRARFCNSIRQDGC